MALTYEEMYTDICPIHGPYWGDGSGCDQCLEDKEEYQEGAPND